jgi:hypothetical protein
VGALPNLNTIFKQYGDWWCQERGGRCDRMNLVQPGYEQYRFVLTDQRIEYYDEPDSQIDPQWGAEQVMTNNTSLEQSQTVLLSKQTTSTFSYQFQEGFEISISAEFSVNVPPIASAKTSVTTKVSFAATQAQTNTEQKTWTVQQPIRVPPHTEVKAVLLIDEMRFSQRFHSKATLGGWVCSNSPDRIDGHYFWFHPVTSIFAKFPQRGFTPLGSTVQFEGDGIFNGLMGVRTNLRIDEHPIGDPSTVLNSYTIHDPLIGAGVSEELAPELTAALKP